MHNIMCMCGAVGMYIVYNIHEEESQSSQFIILYIIIIVYYCRRSPLQLACI